MLDEADSLDGIHGGVDELRVASGQGKGQGIEYQRFGAQAVFLHGDFVDAPGYFQFTLGSLGHAAFVNGQTKHSGVVALGQGKDLIGFGAPGFQVGGVEQATAGGRLEGDLHHVRFGGVNHQRHIHAHFEFLDHLAHQLALVGTLRHSHGNVQGVRAPRNLGTRQLQDSVVIFGQQDLLELAAALGVAAFADQERGRILNEGHGLNCRGEGRNGLQV